MREVIKTDSAPTAIGPYSQAIKATSGIMVFCSGQIPLDPATMKIVGESAADQCRQVLKNLGEVLKASGANWSQVAKTTIFLASMSDFTAVNEVYAEVFQNDPPARATIEVAGLPMGVKVEIDAIAML